jgi:hypothetical protein
MQAMLPRGGGKGGGDRAFPFGEPRAEIPLVGRHGPIIHDALRHFVSRYDNSVFAVTQDETSPH